VRNSLVENLLRRGAARWAPVSGVVEDHPENNVSMTAHRFGELAVLLGNLRKRDVETDDLGAGLVEFFDQRHVDVARPRPALLLRVECLAVDPDDDDLGARVTLATHAVPDVLNRQLEGLADTEEHAGAGNHAGAGGEQGPPALLLRLFVKQKSALGSHLSYLLWPSS